MKKLLSILGLSLFAAVSVGAGIGICQNKAEPVKADGEKWMITICFDNVIPETSGSWGYIENRKVNFWGTNVYYDASVQSFHSTGRDFFYAVNVVFNSEQSVSGMQINFTENGVKKQSQDIAISLDSSCNGRVYTFSFPEEVSWVDGKWSVTSHGYHVPTAQFGPSEAEKKVNKTFTADPETASYYIKDLVIDLSTDVCYAKFCPFSETLFDWDNTYDIMRTDSSHYSEYFYDWHGAGWLEFKVGGTYDLFITNEFKEGGIMDVRKHETPVDSYVYYVTQSSDSTTDKFYTYNSATGEEFSGEWPGTSVTSITNVVEYFNDTEDFKFNHSGYTDDGGYSRNRVVYKIPVTVGYPQADRLIIATASGDKQSDTFEISAGTAYFWRGDYSWSNIHDAKALDFIIMAEAFREAASDDSVCNIGTSDAADIYDAYDALLVPQKTIVNQCKLYTYTDKTKTAKADTSYEDIVNRIGVIGGKVAPSVDIAFEMASNSNTSFIFVIVIVSVSFVGLASVLIIKKRKHN